MLIRVGSPVRAALAGAALLAALLTLPACKHRSGPSGPPRSYRMGFSWFPPRPEVPLALQVIDAWRTRADAALIQTSPPWTQLLAGDNAMSLVAANEQGLADYYRNRGLQRIVVSIDPTNGLDRSADADALANVGRSLTEGSVQQLFRDYVVAMATLLHPDELGVASETNLVRSQAPALLYQAVVQAAGAAAADVRTFDSNVGLFVTVQVEVAWGPGGSSFVGIDADRIDFPFVTSLGLSSYPFLGGFTDPVQLPDDYFSRLVANAPLPVFALEGGWPSVTTNGVPSTTELQRQYVVRQASLLDSAGATDWFQITFTDLDVTAYPGTDPFANLGFVTTAFAIKPALHAWDQVFARPRQ